MYISKTISFLKAVVVDSKYDIPAERLPVQHAVLAGVVLAAVDGRGVDRDDGDEGDGEGEYRLHPVHDVDLR